MFNNNLSNSIKDKFYQESIINLKKNKNSINLTKDNMIYLKLNFNSLKPHDKINSKKYDLAFFYNSKNSKIVNNITSKKFISSGYPYLILVRDRGVNDNLIVILPTPKIKQSGGSNNSVFMPSRESGKGYDPNIHLDKGYKLGQYEAPTINVSNLGEEFQDHKSGEYPADPAFGVNDNVTNYKNNFKKFENGFSQGFDNGYHKGYYFGYSAASAYLYRFYKKYYSDYVDKYHGKLKKNSLLKKFKKPPNLKGGGLFTSYEDKHLDNIFEGLPSYMAPANVLTLEALQPEKKGIFKFIDNLLDPPPPSEDPKYHCKKPDKSVLDNILRQFFNPQFRYAITGVDNNWDDIIFKKSCNRRELKLMDYCMDKNDPGIKFDQNINKYVKDCKLMSDEDKNLCIIL